MVYVCIVTKIMESIFLAMTIVLMVETLLHANALLPALVYFFFVNIGQFMGKQNLDQNGWQILAISRLSWAQAKHIQSS